MAFMIHHYRNRTRAFDIQLFEANGSTEVLLAAQDAVMIQIYRVGSEPAIVLKSWEVDPGGSKVTFTAGTNDVCMTLAQGDTDVNDIETGAWDLDIVVLDDSDRVGSPAENVPAKHAQTGVLFIHPSGIGSIQEEESSGSSASSPSS